MVRASCSGWQLLLYLDDVTHKEGVESLLLFSDGVLFPFAGQNQLQDLFCL